MTSESTDAAATSIAGTTARQGWLASTFGGLPRSFWVLWVGTLVNRLGTMVLPFLSLYLTAGRGVSLTTAGIVLALVGAGQAVSQIIGGALADRVGRRRTIAASMVLTGATMIALGHADSVGPIAVLGFALGLFMDAFRPAAQALVADSIDEANRARAFGLLFWAVNIGFSVAMVAGGVLARSGFWPLFWADAVTCVAFGLLVLRGVPDTPRVSTAPVGGTLLDVLRDRVMVHFVLITFAVAVVYLQCLSTLPLAMRADGRSTSDYGIAMALNGVVIIILQPLAGRRLARHDLCRVLATGCALLGLGFGAAALATSRWAYCATVVVWTCGEVVIQSVGSALVADLSPARLRGRYAGVYGTAWGVAALLAPVVGTALLTVGAATLWSACLVLGGGAAAALLLVGPSVRARQAMPR